MSAFLNRADIERLTERQRYGAQCKVLDARGIRYTRAGANRDGEPLVRPEDVDAEGKPAHRPPSGPRWDAIGSVRQLKPRAA
jgi:hypothetical protein